LLTGGAALGGLWRLTCRVLAREMAALSPEKHDLERAARRAEITKVFRAVDKDGSGTIDPQELKTLIQLVLGAPPADETVGVIGSKIDTSADGVIQEDEFVNAVDKWLVESERMVRKRSRSEDLVGSPQSRRKLQMGIKQFFQQSAHDELHEQLSARDMKIFEYAKAQLPMAMEQISSLTDNAPDMDFWKTGLAEPTAESKAAVLGEVQRLYAMDGYLWLNMLQALLQPTETHAGEIHEALVALNMCLDMMDAFPSPEERYALSAPINDMFRHMTSFRVTDPRTIREMVATFLSPQAPEEFRLQACRAMRRYIQGPRIPHTPPKSPFHPDSVNLKEWAMEANVIRCVWQMLQMKATSETAIRLKEEAVRFLGAFVDFHPAVALHMAGDLDPPNGTLLMSLIVDDFMQGAGALAGATPEAKTLLQSYLNTCVYTLSTHFQALEGADTPVPVIPHMDLFIQTAVEPLAQAEIPPTYLVNILDLLEVCSRSVLSPEQRAQLSQTLIARMTELRKMRNPVFENSKVVIAVTHSMNSIWRQYPKMLEAAHGDEAFITTLLEVAKDDLRHSEANVVSSTLKTIQICFFPNRTLGFTGGEVQRAKAVQAVQAIVPLLSHANLDILTYATRMIAETVDFAMKEVVDAGVVPTLFDNLKRFKHRDQVMLVLYDHAPEFMRSSYNFHMVELTLTALLKIANSLDAVQIVRFFGDLNFCDETWNLFKLLCDDVKRGALALYSIAEQQDPMAAAGEVAGGVDEAVEVQQQLFELSKILVAVQKMAMKEGTKHPREAALRSWADSWQGACEAQRRRAQVSMDGSGDVMLREAAASAGVELEEEDSLNVAKVRFEPMWADSEAETHRVPLNLNDEFFSQITQFFTDKYGQRDPVYFQTSKAADKRISNAEGLRVWLHSTTSAADRVVYLSRPNVGYHDSTLPPKQIALHKVFPAGGRGHGALSREWLEKFYDIFRRLTAHLSGRSDLNMEEFVALMCHQDLQTDLNLKLSVDDAQKLFHAFDIDRSSTVDFQEILIGVSLLVDGTHDQKLEHLFLAFDLDGNGRIDETELTRMIAFLQNFNEPAARAMAQKWIFEFDDTSGTGEGGSFDQGQKDGVLNLDEFKRAMYKNSWVLGDLWNNGLNIEGRFSGSSGGGRGGRDGGRGGGGRGDRGDRGRGGDHGRGGGRGGGRRGDGGGGGRGDQGRGRQGGEQPVKLIFDKKAYVLNKNGGALRKEVGRQHGCVIWVKDNQVFGKGVDDVRSVKTGVIKAIKRGVNM